MLQTLLAQRFAVKVHRETRVLPAYELTVAKSGSKLKEIDTEHLPGLPDPGSQMAPPPPVSSTPVGLLGSESIRMAPERSKGM
jgi:uncharacterized protein (TIGR03435 family)